MYEDSGWELLLYLICQWVQPMLLETIMPFVWKMEIVSTNTILIMLQASCNGCYCHFLFYCLVCMLFLLHERKCIHWSSTLAATQHTFTYQDGIGGRPVAMDVTVISPVQQQLLPLAANNSGHVSRLGRSTCCCAPRNTLLVPEMRGYHSGCGIVYISCLGTRTIE